MQLFKQKSRSKTSNKKLKFKKNSFFSKKRFLPVAGIFGLIGGYLVYQSFAFTPLLAGSNGEFVPLAPNRIMDTRTGNGGYNVALPANGTYSLQVSGRGGVPQASSVSAVVLSVVAAAPQAAGFMTVWPSGVALPNASSLNYATGQTIANQVTVKVGTDGKIQFYSSSSTHVIVDISGYYSTESGEAGSRYTSLSPSRIFDTRNGIGGYSTQIPAQGTYNVKVLGLGGVPQTGVSAVVVNVTAVSATADGFATIWPKGVALPNASSLNYRANENIAKLVTVPVGADGSVSLYSYSGSPHFIFDVVGYYDLGADAADLKTQSGRFVPLNPARVMDTRNGIGGYSAPLPANGTYSLQLGGRGGVPTTNVSAVVLNVTAVAPQADGFITVWPSGEPLPNASSLNFKVAQGAVANQVVALVGPDGKIQISGPASLHLIVDVAGYFVESEEYTTPATYVQFIADRSNNTAPYINSTLNADITVANMPQSTGAYVDTYLGGHNVDYTNHRQYAVRVNVKTGVDEIEKQCYQQAEQKCKVLASNGVQTAPSLNLSSIKIPYELSTGVHKLVYEIKADQPGYSGRWLTTSIVGTNGVKIGLFTEQLDATAIIYQWPHFSVGQLKYSCTKPSLLSVKIGNLLIDGSSSYTLRNANQQTNDTLCAGFSKTTYKGVPVTAPDVYTIIQGVAKAQRDITPPVLSALTFDSVAKVVRFSATDNEYIESFGMAENASGGSVVREYTKNLSREWPLQLSSGTHTVRVWVTDNSGNRTEKPLAVTIP